MNLNNMLVNMLLGRLKNQNPTAYQQVTQMMNSGQNAEQIINNMLASGQINQNQLNQAKQMANQFINSNNQGPRRF